MFCDFWLLVPRPALSQNASGHRDNVAWSPASSYPAKPAADYPNRAPFQPTSSPRCEMSHSPACKAAQNKNKDVSQVRIQPTIGCRNPQSPSFSKQRVWLHKSAHSQELNIPSCGKLLFHITNVWTRVREPTRVRCSRVSECVPSILSPHTVTSSHIPLTFLLLVQNDC